MASWRSWTWQDIKQKGIECVKKHDKGLRMVGTALAGLGAITPIGGDAISGFGSICTYLGELGKTKKEEEEKLKEEALKTLDDLNALMDYIGQLSTTILKWTEKQRNESQLWKLVQTTYAAVIFWEQQIKKGQTPKDLSGSIHRKLTNLQQLIGLETIADIKNVQSILERLEGKVDDVKKTTDDVKKTTDDIKKLTEGDPETYYTRAKDFYTHKRWLEAKHQFMEYKRCVKDGVKGIRDPTSDHHLEYLFLIQEELLKDELATISGKGNVLKENVFKQEWEAWKKTHHA
jgi:hypothetical protein